MTEEYDPTVQALSRLKTERDELRRKEQLNKDEKEKAIKYVKNLVDKHRDEKNAFMVKITMLEDALVRDKENKADYLNMQAKDDQLDELRQSQDRIQQEAKHARSQLGDIRAKLTEADTERVQLLKGHAELESQLGNVRRTTKAKEEQLGSNRRQMAELEQARTAAQNRIQLLQDDNAQLKQHAESLRREMSEHNSKLASKREVDTRKVAQLEVDLNELNVYKSQLQSKVNNSQQRQAQIETELDALKVENGSLLAQIDQLRSTDKQAVDDLRRAESEASKTISSLRMEKRQLGQEIELIKISFAQNETNSRQVHDELKTLRKELTQSESTNDALQAECRETTRKLDNLIDEHRQLQNKLKLMSDEHAVKQSTVEANNDQYQVALDDALGEKDHLQAELDRLEIDFESCQNELRQSRHELEMCQARHNQLVAQVEQEQVDMRQQLNQHCAAQRNRETNLATLETENDQIKGELELARLDVEQLKTELDRVDELLSQKDQNVDELQCQVHELKEEAQIARNAVHDVQAELGQNGQFLAELESEKETLLVSVNQLNLETRQLSDKCRQLEAELADKHARLAKQSRDLVEIADENDQHVDDMARNLTEVQSDKAQLVSVVRELEDQLEEAESNLNKAYEQLEVKEAEAVELSDDLVSERAARTQLEAQYTVLKREQNKVEEIRCESEQRQTAAAVGHQDEVQQYRLALEAAQQDVRETEHEKDELLRQLEMADRKTGRVQSSQRDLERENEQLERKLNEMTRTMKKGQDLKLADHEESEKWRIGYEKTAGMIEAEREKNNQLKHENKELSLSETRLRTQMYQLQKMNEMLQRQNEEKGNKKRKSASKKNEPKLFVPPPMYADLEKQVETLRKDNAKMKAKLFGSNTDLTSIDVVSTPTKPKRTVKTMDIDIGDDSQTALTPGLCYASSLPIYVGDQIVVVDGAKCHQRFVDDFNRIKARAASGKKNVSTGGELKRLVDGEWISVEMVIKNNALMMKSAEFTDTLTLAANWAIHGSVHFEQVSYMAEVDHELCFGLEEIDMKEMVYFCAQDLIDKQTWYYNIDKQLNRPTLPMSDRTKVKVKKVKEFAATPSGSYPAILSACFVGAHCLLGTMDALLLLSNDELTPLMPSTPVYKVDCSDEAVFVIRGNQRQFGYILTSHLHKAIGSSVASIEGRFVPLVSRNCHTFALGRFHGKHGVAVAADETVRVFIFAHDQSAEEIHSFRLDQIPSSLIFTSTSIITGTEPMIEFDLRTGSAEAYLGDDELAKIYSEKPIDMFRLYDKGAERILVCAQHGGFVVNNGGRIVSQFQWNSIPLAFHHVGDFLYISHFFNLEVIRIGIDRNSPPAALASYRPRLIGAKRGDDSVIVYSRPFGGNKHRSAIKLLTGTEEIELDHDETYLSSIPSSFEPIYQSPFKNRKSRDYSS